MNTKKFHIRRKTRGHKGGILKFVKMFNRLIGIIIPSPNQNIAAYNEKHPFENINKVHSLGSLERDPAYIRLQENIQQNRLNRNHWDDKFVPVYHDVKNGSIKNTTTGSQKREQRRAERSAA